MNDQDSIRQAVRKALGVTEDDLPPHARSESPKSEPPLDQPPHPPPAPFPPSDIPAEQAATEFDTADWEAVAPCVAPPEVDPQADAPPKFLPAEPTTLAEARLSPTEVEALALKFLLNIGAATGRRISEQIKLPFNIVQGQLARMKSETLIVYRNSAPVGDYLYELTEAGAERARRYSVRCTYYGAAPVSLKDYIDGVRQQSLSWCKPTIGDLCRAFSDLVLSNETLSQLGQAMHGGRGLFLHGPPGNGKSSIAERVTRVLGEHLWIPRTISVFGEIIRLYDPGNHKEAPLSEEEQVKVAIEQIDGRWVRIVRPTIVVGGELTLENLDVTVHGKTGINEAPLQLKSNGGTLVIDDFGRQRMTTEELLNRWIIPLEKGFDFLNLSSGRKIQVPFDQMIVFSTNLEPKDIVDEAFLRRIPYKIDVQGPTEAQFRELFETVAEQMGVEVGEDAFRRLVDEHFRRSGREFRFCHARDILRQVVNYCSFHARPRIMTDAAIDAAVKNYFGAL